MYSTRFSRARAAIVVISVAALLLTGLGLPTADAAGPPYDGPQTEATGPAFFGPAPNPFPYCENPTYFDPFPENVNPIGRIDVTGAPNASVTTNGVTLSYELTAEGDPGGQYPGFFPEGADGGPGDQPKGLEMAAGDAGIISLSEPLFYTQWVFTDVDRENEGFFVTPTWAGPAGQVAVFGGDSEFDFTGTTVNEAVFNDVDTVGHDSEAIEGRVQVDLLGAASGISVLRDVGSGQSGFAIGGGCEPVGAAKELTSGPTWNGTSFDVTYTIRVRNNLPSAATIGADVNAALAAAASGVTTGDPVGIELLDVTLEDLLTDPAFSSVVVVSNESSSGNIVTSDTYNGVDDISLLAPGETVPPETNEEIVLTLQYIPEAAGPLGDACAADYQLENQARVGGVADGVDVEDLSDDGVDPDPGVGNGNAGVDDPTPVTFECPPDDPAPVLEIVKTVVEGPAGTCPAFAAGIGGDGDALAVDPGDTVTYCISVNNPGTVDIDNVIISDPQAPAGFNGDVGTLAAGTEATVSFDLPITDATPEQNIASATGDDPAGGQLPPVTDPAIIDIAEPPPVTPAIALSKTVLAGADADCSTVVEGEQEFVLGMAGDAITWCFVALNTGDVELTSVIFNDGPAEVVDLDLLDGVVPPVLNVGEVIAFSFNGTIPENGIENTASVSAVASDPTGVPIPNVPGVEDENEAAVNEASLDLTKTIAAGANADCATASELVTVNQGAPVTYCFTVTNTGGVTVRVAEVVDDTLGITIPIPAASQDLAPGAAVTVTHSAPALADLVNTASVTGVPIDDETGEPFPDAPELVPLDTAEVDTLTADISIVKSNNGNNLVTRGLSFPYTLDIANAGPDAAVNVVVVDTLPEGLVFAELPVDADWSCSADLLVLTCNKATPLQPGETVSLNYDVGATLAAPVGVDLINTATVDSDTPDPNPDDNEDTEPTIVQVPPDPTEPDELLTIVTINNPPDPAPPSPAVPTPAVPPLAVTGVHTSIFAMASAAMAAAGGVFFVGGRRRFDEHRD